MIEKFPNELDNLMKMFNEGKSTLDVKNYLMNKYKCTQGSTSRVIRLARKKLGIYEGTHTEHK